MDVIDDDTEILVLDETVYDNFSLDDGAPVMEIVKVPGCVIVDNGVSLAWIVDGEGIDEADSVILGNIDEDCVTRLDTTEE